MALVRKRPIIKHAVRLYHPLVFRCGVGASLLANSSTLPVRVKERACSRMIVGLLVNVAIGRKRVSRQHIVQLGGDWQTIDSRKMFIVGKNDIAVL